MQATEQRAEIVRLARAYCGTPFAHKGRSRRGVDCAGLIYVVFHEATGLTQDFTDYEAQLRSGFVFRTIGAFATRILQEDAGPGDVMLINFGGSSSHLGILTDSGIIYPCRDRGRVIEAKMTDRSGVDRGRAVACFRMNGVEAWRN